MANLYIEDGSMSMPSFYRAVGRVAVDKLEAYHQDGNEGIVCMSMTVDELMKLLEMASSEKLASRKDNFTAQLKGTNIVVDIDLAILKP